MARAEPAAANSAKGEPDPLIGRTINGRFKIVSVIARGGMGKVYRAEQAPLGRLCALKVLSPKYEGDRDPEFHKRFFLEASTAAKLTHPNTVTIFDYGQSDDVYFIAMEYIEGRTLHRVLRDEGTLSEARVVHIASQICRSLREAHGLGVVHRDLKPGNILLSERGDEHDIVKVLDFGLVKDVSGEAEDLTQAGLFMGSPKYMAPEQILGGEISPCTDIYSLGVMMYEMLCGKVPFDRGASVGTLMAHVNDAPPSIRVVKPGVQLSPAMEQVVSRCLEKDAAKRYPSMKELLNALKRVGIENGTAMTDTQESMPMARLDSATSGAHSLDSLIGHTPILQSASNRPSSSPSGITDSSLMQPGPAPPLDTDAMAKMKPKGRPVLVALAALAAVGIGAVVLVSSNKAPGTDGPGAGTSQAVIQAPVETAKPVQTAAETAKPAPTAVAPTIRVVHIETDPKDATITENGTQRCSSTPCDVVYKDEAAGQEHTLAVAKAGFKPGKITVGTSDEKASTKLERLPLVPVTPVTPSTGASPYKHGAYD
ncbi:MAG: serine/threonine-protein kinase [Byssovorax sp.]